MKNKNFNKLHNNIGKILCGVAGAIIGGIVVGPLFAVPGALLGFFAGYSLQNLLLTPRAL
jgi:hypothetical protein